MRGAGPVVAVAIAILAGDAVLLEYVLWALSAEASAVLSQVTVVLAGPAECTGSLHLHRKGDAGTASMLSHPQIHAGTTAWQHPGLHNISQHPTDPQTAACATLAQRHLLLTELLHRMETPSALRRGLPIVKSLPAGNTLCFAFSLDLSQGPLLALSLHIKAFLMPGCRNQCM